MYDHNRISINRVRLPILRGQLKRDNFFFLSPFTPENLVSRDGSGRPVPRQSAHIPHNQVLVLTHGIPRDFCDGVHLFISPYAIGSVPSLLGHHAVAYRWCLLPRVRRNRTSSPQRSSSSGCCLAGHHGPIDMRLLCAFKLLVVRLNIHVFPLYSRMSSSSSSSSTFVPVVLHGWMKWLHHVEW